MKHTEIRRRTYRTHEDPGPGRRRMEITVRFKGEILFHKAGPANIVLGLYKKFLEKHPGVARSHGEGQVC